MVSILIEVVEEHVAVSVNFNHVLKFSVQDEVNLIGQWFLELKLSAQVSLFS